MDTSPRWHEPTPPGEYVATAWIPGNLLNEGLITVRGRRLLARRAEAPSPRGLHRCRLVPRAGSRRGRLGTWPLHRPVEGRRPAAARLDDRGTLRTTGAGRRSHVRRRSTAAATESPSMRPRSSREHRDPAHQRRHRHVRVARSARRHARGVVGSAGQLVRGGRRGRRLWARYEGRRGSVAARLRRRAVALVAAERRLSEGAKLEPRGARCNRKLPRLSRRRLSPTTSVHRGCPPGGTARLVPREQASQHERGTLRSRLEGACAGLALVDAPLVLDRAPGGVGGAARGGSSRAARAPPRPPASLAARAARLRASLRRLRVLPRRCAGRLRAGQRVRHAVHGLGRRGRRARDPASACGTSVWVAWSPGDAAPPLARGAEGADVVEPAARGGDRVELASRGGRRAARGRRRRRAARTRGSRT